MRPIDVDALKEKFEDILDRTYKDDYAKGFVAGLYAALNMPTLTPPNEWVSVEEKLPGVSGNYICAVKDKNGSVWTIPAEWSLEMKMWIGAFGEIKNIVTHWMSLPEPPEKEKE